MACLDHRYERGVYGVCRRCGGESPRADAVSYVDSALRDVLPPGVPPSFAAIESAHWSGSGKRRTAHGRLTMFDGLPALVEVWNSGGLTAHRFTEMPGGDCSFEGGRWVRVSREAV